MEKSEEISLTNRLSENEVNHRLQQTNADIIWFGFDLRSSFREDARQYLPFITYLSDATGLKFEIYIVPGKEHVVDALGSGRIQFAALGAGSYLLAHEKYSVLPLVRGLNSENRAEYRSVIVVRHDGPIRTIGDLRGAHFAFGNVTSTQGHIIPGIVLAKYGIRLSELRSYEYTGSHHNCANAVLTGRADACGMQDTMGIELEKAGLVRIIHTSGYYPSSGICANKGVSPEILSRVKKALLDFDPKGRHAAGLYHWDRTEMPNGFVPAADGDYAELRAWAERLGVFSALGGGTAP